MIEYNRSQRASEFLVARLTLVMTCYFVSRPNSPYSGGNAFSCNGLDIFTAAVRATNSCIYRLSAMGTSRRSFRHIFTACRARDDFRLLQVCLNIFLCSVLALIGIFLQGHFALLFRRKSPVFVFGITLGLIALCDAIYECAYKCYRYSEHYQICHNECHFLFEIMKLR